MYTYVTGIAARTWIVSTALAGLAALGPASSSAQAAEALPACINSTFGDGHLALHFDRPQRADDIALTTFHAPAHSVLRVSDGMRSVALVASDTPDERRAVHLRAPLHGTDFTVSIVRDPSGRGEAGVCITRMQLRDGKKLLVPHHPAVGPTAQMSAPIGAWRSSSTNCCQATLRFERNGSWQLQTRQKLLEGSWRLESGQLQMRLKTQGVWVSMHPIRQTLRPSYADDGELLAPGHTDLMLSAALTAELGGVFERMASD